MRPVVLAWLARHGIPAVLLPDYFMLAAIAVVVGSLIALRLAKRDGASVVHTARAIACAYLAALAGGYVFEALRAIPAALVAGSWRPVTHAGRAAYGGLLAAIVAAAAYLKSRGAEAGPPPQPIAGGFGNPPRVPNMKISGEPLAPFFDRVAIGTGLTFALVRTGCFLAGCDYGMPTASVLGVRFPPGSLAAIDHLRRGFVPPGAPSLPVHPTQLYEAALGLCAAAAAAVPIARGRRDGTAFATFLSIYAAGRFAIELLRGDQDRGAALGLSTAQWVSVSIAIALGIAFARRARRRASAEALEAPNGPAVVAATATRIT